MKGMYLVIVAVLTVGASTSTASAQDKINLASVASRGQMLYENHCISCHDSVVHVREKRRAKSIGDVEHWVRRWSFDVGLGWKDEEVDAVTHYLVRRYYRFDQKK